MVAALLFGILALLGLAATAVVAASGLRLSVEPAADRGGRPALPLPDRPVDAPPTGQPPVRQGGSGSATILAPAARSPERSAPGVMVESLSDRTVNRRPPVAGLIAGLLLVFVAVGYPVLRYLAHGAAQPVPSGTSTGRILLDTWLPPLISAGIGVAVALAAGYGIGALRPLGPASEWLLLPFGPWLFVGSGPQTLREFAAGRTGDSLLALVPPGRVAIPALVVFTLLFRGLRDGRPAAGFAARYLRPALPMALLAFGVAWLVQAQDALWPLVAAPGAHPTGPALVTRLLAAAPAGAEPGAGLALPVWLWLLLFLAAAALQLSYLDRISATTPAGPPATTPHPSGE
jgi:hypothetical protein